MVILVCLYACYTPSAVLVSAPQPRRQKDGLMVCGLILALMTSKYSKAMSTKDSLIFRFVD